MTDQPRISTDEIERVRASLGDIYEAAKTSFEFFEAYRVAGFTESQALYLVARMLTAGMQQNEAPSG